MKTWNDYKEYVRTVDPETAKDIKETEEVAAIVTAMILHYLLHKARRFLRVAKNSGRTFVIIQFFIEIIYRKAVPNCEVAYTISLFERTLITGRTITCV